LEGGGGKIRTRTRRSEQNVKRERKVRYGTIKRRIDRYDRTDATGILKICFVLVENQNNSNNTRINNTKTTRHKEKEGRNGREKTRTEEAFKRIGMYINKTNTKNLVR